MAYWLVCTVSLSVDNFPNENGPFHIGKTNTCLKVKFGHLGKNDHILKGTNCRSTKIDPHEGAPKCTWELLSGVFFDRG